tara:strand:+ start:366 stop:569 length:204 start_codon:yes stop_codon:yes gene_type:complete
MRKIRIEKGNSDDFLLSNTSFIKKETNKGTVVSKTTTPDQKSSYQRANLSDKQKKRREQHKLRKGES